MGIFRLAFQRFTRVRGAEAAASMSFYAIYSLFPLLLVIVSVVGYGLVNFTDPNQILDFIVQAFPLAQSLIEQNFLQILENRGTIGLIGVVGSLWAASGVFTTLVRNINRAWPTAHSHTLVMNRLLALGMVAGLALLLGLWLLASTVVSVITSAQIPFFESPPFFLSPVWRTLAYFVPWLIAFVVFISLYRWIPNTLVFWSEAFWGAVFATIAWEIATRVFSWFIGSGLANYELLYGSLGTSVAFLTWIYVTFFITLLGAHLSASIAQATRLQDRAHITKEEGPV